MNLFRSFSLNSRSGAVEALNVTGVAAAGGKILATDVSGDSMLNFFQDISSNTFLGDVMLKFFFFMRFQATDMSMIFFMGSSWDFMHQFDLFVCRSSRKWSDRVCGQQILH